MIRKPSGRTLRNGTKSILHPYSSYRAHWVIGFIYEQREIFEAYNHHNIPKPGIIPSPYTIKDVFIREKFEITGLRAGSGNTKNIGSAIARTYNAFSIMKGPFTHFERGKEACDLFWGHYKNYINQISNLNELLSHPDFVVFCPIQQPTTNTKF